MPVTLGHCEVLHVLFFSYLLLFIWPLPARPFIFSYLLLFIWPLPCPPFYFSLSFTLYLAPALPALLFFLIFYSLFGPCPSRTALPPAPPCPVWPPVFPNPIFRIQFSADPLKRGTVVGRTDTVVIIYKKTLLSA
jgi:hypothetical protein